MEDKRILHDSEEEAEEALSLSDLPVTAIGREDCRFTSDDGVGKAGLEEEFEFFGSWVGEMCAAEDVFYQGRILPLRPSVSSDPGFRSGSRSGSSCFDSSRSSSRSSNSSSGRRSESLLMHPFYALPSPKPQMGRRSFAAAPASGGGRRGGGWGLLKLGLVQPPPARIELLDLRQRSFRKSNNGVGNPKHKTLSDDQKAKKKKDDGGGSWLAGLSCKCSASAVETVSSSVVVKKRGESLAEEETGGKEEEEALMGERRRRRRRNGRGATHRRTYEWLERLSTGDGPHA